MKLVAELTCRGCGCNDRQACPGGCGWVLLDVDMPTGICSECAEEVEWDPRVLAEWNMPEPDEADHRGVLLP